MKRSIKAVLALLTSITMTMGAVGFSAYAEDAPSAVTVTELPGTETGTFKGGAGYTYVISSGALVIDGDGTFTISEYNELIKKCSPTIVSFGKNAVPSGSSKELNQWIASVTGFASDYTALAENDSKFQQNYLAMKNSLKARVIVEKKEINRASITLSDMFSLDMIDDYTKDPVSFFTISDPLVEKGKKVTGYLVDNGISERTAKKITAIYLLGLKKRINNFCAYPDGRESSEETEAKNMKAYLKIAKTEDELMVQLTDEGLTFDNAVSYLTDKGIFLTKKHNTERLQDISDKLHDAFSAIYNGTQPDDLKQAERAEYESKYISPDLSDIDMVLEYRGKWMKDNLDEYEIDENIVKEAIELYLEGLKLRIQEGRAQNNGEELNDNTSYEYMQACRDYIYAKNALNIAEANGGSADSIKLESMKILKEKQMLVSDYVHGYEYEANKYFNSRGEYVDYLELSDKNGTLPDGIEYHYSPLTRGIYLTGEGSFTRDDLLNLEHNFIINFYIMGKNVGYSNSIKHYFSKIYIESDDLVSEFNHWLFTKIRSAKRIRIYTVPDSPTIDEYNSFINYCFENQDSTSLSALEYPIKDKETIEKTFPLHIIQDEDKLFEILNGTKKAVPDGVEATLKGDADENGIVELSDVIAIAKFTINDRIYPLKSDIAKANADINGDNMINTLDTSALIEIQMGKKQPEL